MVKQVLNGGGGMPAFKGQLTNAQIAAVAAYVLADGREVARLAHGSAHQSAAPIAPAWGPSSAVAIAIRSSGATRARSAIDGAALEQEVARPEDAAADHDALRAEEDQHVRDREPEQVADALERVRRLARYVQIEYSPEALQVSVPFDLTSFKKS